MRTFYTRQRYFSKLEEHYLVPVVLILTIISATATIYFLSQHNLTQSATERDYWLGVTKALQGKTASLADHARIHFNWSIYIGLTFISLVISLVAKIRILYILTIVFSLTLFWLWAF